MEARSECGGIELFYGDETGVGEVGYVPYGWQSKGENIAIKAQRGRQLNCFGILSRTNKLLFKITEQRIDADFIIDFFENMSFNIRKLTVVILDNARIHTCRKVRQQVSYWQQRGLYIFYLPPYSPHLNIIERMWKELKARWLKPQDYNSFDELNYAVIQNLNQVGKELKINFAKYC